MTQAIDRGARIAAPGGALPATGAAVMTVAVGAANGGYFPTAWGWAGLALSWLALVVLLLRADVAFSRLGIAFVAAGAAFVGWVALSTAWSVNPSQTVLEVERDIVYVAVAVVVLLVRRVQPLLAGVLAGATMLCAYGLATRLLPDRLGVFDPIAAYRLSEPLGYWNGLGVLAAMGTLLAVGFAADSRSLAGRAWAAASVVVLVPTLYFTFSRGGWIALALGLVALVALHPRRLQLVAVMAAGAPAPALAVVVAWRLHSLNTSGAELVAASRDGHRLALLIVALAAAAAGLAVANALTERRWRAAPAMQRVLSGVLVAAVVAAGGVAVAQYGSPVAMVERAWHAFAARPDETGPNLNARLFSFSGTGRVPQWRVAVEQYDAHRVVGSGAGTYEQFWLSDRQNHVKVRDAHNLYLEVLAELGPFGLALLTAFLAVPLLAVRRARRHPLTAAAASAYVAYLAHAAVDWDWEMLVVTSAAVACGGTVVVGAGGGMVRRARLPAALVVAAIGVAAFVGLLSNLQLSRASRAAGAGDWTAAAKHARRAHTWAPWSSRPWQELGEAQLARGDNREARASFRAAIDKSPRDWNLWFDLARATTGKAQAAALRQATRLNPLSPEIAQLQDELAAQGAITIGK